VRSRSASSALWSSLRPSNRRSRFMPVVIQVLLPIEDLATMDRVFSVALGSERGRREAGVSGLSRVPAAPPALAAGRPADAQVGQPFFPSGCLSRNGRSRARLSWPDTWPCPHGR